MWNGFKRHIHLHVPVFTSSWEKKFCYETNNDKKYHGMCVGQQENKWEM